MERCEWQPVSEMAAVAISKRLNIERITLLSFLCSVRRGVMFYMTYRSVVDLTEGLP